MQKSQQRHPLQYNLEKVGLKTTLYEYQLEGILWMINQEINSHCTRGGILADDMGLGKTLQVLSLIFHQNYLNTGEPTLVILPSASLIHSWLKEIKRHYPQKLRSNNLYYIFHSSNPDKKSKYHTIRATDLQRYNIVFTTYATYCSNVKSSTTEKENSKLLSIKWRRVILDEAHFIKNKKTAAFQKISRLVDCSEYKWCLTGTPLLNNEMEYHSLLQFIEAKPYADAKWFTEHIVTVCEQIKNGFFFSNQIRTSAIQEMSNNTMLRRTKETVIGLKGLPMKLEKTVPVVLSLEEKAIYENAKTNTKGNYARILRLKQAVNSDKNVGSESQGSKLGTFKSLLLQIRGAQQNPLTEDFLYRDAQQIEHTLPVQLQTNRQTKVLVFSQFHDMLDKLETVLKDLALPYERIDGNVSTGDREDAIKRFNSTPGCVMLLGLKAGNVGLNLQQANVVFLMDHWWNPATEEQAIDRAHRVGSKFDHVYVFRLLTDSEIENFIMTKKQVKKQLFSVLVVPTDHKSLLNKYESLKVEIKLPEEDEDSDRESEESQESEESEEEEYEFDEGEDEEDELNYESDKSQSESEKESEDEQSEEENYESEDETKQEQVPATVKSETLDRKSPTPKTTKSTGKASDTTINKLLDELSNVVLVRKNTCPQRKSLNLQVNKCIELLESDASIEAPIQQAIIQCLKKKVPDSTDTETKYKSDRLFLVRNRRKLTLLLQVMNQYPAQEISTWYVKLLHKELTSTSVTSSLPYRSGYDASTPVPNIQSL